jgi:1-acyl-sn-glycerol-3-phosphate acyltransferase
MAVKLRIPVVPIYIGGMFQVYSREDSWPKAGPVHVSIGKPMRFPANARIEDATQAIRDAIVKLAEEAEEPKTS